MLFTWVLAFDPELVRIWVKTTYIAAPRKATISTAADVDQRANSLNHPDRACASPRAT
jgi:hypothetical protein